MKEYSEFRVRIYHSKGKDYSKPYYALWIKRVLSNYSNSRKVMVRRIK